VQALAEAKEDYEAAAAAAAVPKPRRNSETLEEQLAWLRLRLAVSGERGRGRAMPARASRWRGALGGQDGLTKAVRCVRRRWARWTA
jgi:hypothetical protein